MMTRPAETAPPAPRPGAEAPTPPPPPESVDVIFIIPPCWGVDAPPCGASYVSGYLQDQGFSVEVRDINVELYHHLGPEHHHLWRQESYRIWELADPFYETLLPRFADWLALVARSIIDHHPRVVCFSINVASVIFSVHLAEMLKRQLPGLRIVFGGNQCRFGVGNTHLPPGLFGPALRLMGLVDAVVMGEGEEVAHQLVDRVLKGQPLIDIPGAVTLDDGLYGNFLHKPENPSLDALGFPSFAGYPLGLYLERHVPMLLSRGCRFGCAFCNERLQFEGFRCRSGEEVFQEVVQHQDRYGTELFHFCDLVINGAPEALLQFCRRVAASGRRVVWSSQAVMHRSLTDDEVVATLVRGGCDHLIFGVESFSERIMRQMGKPYPPQMVDEVLRTCARHGLGAVINLIVGFPGETEADLAETVAGLRRNAPYISMVSSVGECLVPPGSTLEKRFKEYGLVLPDRDRFIHWSMPGNTHELRLERLQRILQVLAEEGLGYYKTTRYDETLQENLQARRPGPAFLPRTMLVTAGPDRSSASFSFVSASVQEPKGPSAEGEADASTCDPGWVYSPLTPMPRPYTLMGEGRAVLRLGGRSVDLFYRRHLINRGQGLSLRLVLDDGRVLKSTGGVWSYVQQGERVLAHCDWGDPAVRLYFRFTPRGEDSFLLEAHLQASGPPGQQAHLQLGLGLYEQLDRLLLNDQPAEPEMPFALPGDIRTVTLLPAEGGLLPRVTLDISPLGPGWSLEQERDMWVEGLRINLRRRVPLVDSTFALLLSLAPSGGEQPQPEGAEQPEGAAQTEAPRPAPAPEEARALSLCRVRPQWLRPDGTALDSLYIPQGGSLGLAFTLYCHRYVHDPLLRVQIHASLPGQPGLLLVGANNHRVGARIEVEEGCFTTGLFRFEALNLAPGTYQVSLSLLSDETPDSETYDVFECAFSLEVTGEREERVCYLARAPLTLQPLPSGATGDAAAAAPQHPRQAAPGHLYLARLAPPQAPEAVCVTVRPGAPLEAELLVAGARAPGDGLEIQICHHQRLLTSWQVALPAGDTDRFRLSVARLDLIRGDYTLSVLPLGRPYAGAQMMVHVRSERHHGGGMIYCPYAVTSQVLPAVGFQDPYG